MARSSIVSTRVCGHEHPLPVRSRIRLGAARQHRDQHRRVEPADVVQPDRLTPFPARSSASSVGGREPISTGNGNAYPSPGAGTKPPSVNDVVQNLRGAAEQSGTRLCLPEPRQWIVRRRARARSLSRPVSHVPRLDRPQRARLRAVQRHDAVGGASRSGGDRLYRRKRRDHRSL